MSHSERGPILLDTIVGELTLLDGQRQPGAAHMAVLTPPRRAQADRRRETLFVFLDLEGGGSRGLAQAMLEQFSRVYWRRSGTVTSAVREAIAEANAHMLDENRLLPVDHRRQGGMVCAVLRDNNLYLAQIGPARALLSAGGRVVGFPGRRPHALEDGAGLPLSPPRPQRLPLGVSSGLDVRFFHRYLNAGDVLLLTGASWDEGLSAGGFGEILSAATGGAEEVMSSLERQSGQGAVSAMIVECVLPAFSEAAAPTSDRSVPPRASDVPAPPPVARQVETESRWQPSNPLAGLLERRESLTQRARQAGETLADGARGLLTRVLPEPEPAPRQWRRRGGRVSKENVPMMAGIAVAIPLLVAFVVVTFYLQRSSSARQESLADKARQAIEAARQAQGEEARTHWETALGAAQTALGAAADDDELIAMRDEARARLDQLDAVRRPELILLWDYGPGEDRRLAAGRMQVYVLDVAQQQVTEHTLDQAGQASGPDSPDLVAYEGYDVGGEEIGRLRDLVWLEAGGARLSDALMILTDDDRLLGYDPSWGLSWVPFDTGLADVDGRVVRPFDGKLYALDPGQSQVWRFPSDGEGFGPPEGYFSAAAPDLSSATDMTIDGAVYIMLADGRIYKFLSGESLPFQPSGLPQPLARPVAIAHEGDATGGAIYVADADSQSVVGLTKGGDFIHQIKAKDGALAGLEAMALEETGRILYLLADGRLYGLSLPPLPESSPDSE